MYHAEVFKMFKIFPLHGASGIKIFLCCATSAIPSARRSANKRSCAGIVSHQARPVREKAVLLNYIYHMSQA